MRHKSFWPVTSGSILVGFTDDGLAVEVGDKNFSDLQFFLMLYCGAAP